jgi:hypothetical protein
MACYGVVWVSGVMMTRQPPGGMLSSGVYLDPLNFTISDINRLEIMFRPECGTLA